MNEYIITYYIPITYYHYYYYYYDKPTVFSTTRFHKQNIGRLGTIRNNIRSWWCPY